MAEGIYGYPGYVSDLVLGESRTVKVEPIFVDEDGVVQEVTLSDYEFHLDIASDLDKDTPVELAIVVAAGDNLDSALKTVDIVINASQSGSLTAGEKYYWITMVRASDPTEVHILDMGKIQAQPGVA